MRPFRILRLLLIPCLIADPAAVPSFTGPDPLPPHTAFDRQALSLIPGFIHSVSPRIQARIHRAARRDGPTPVFSPFIRDLIPYNQRTHQFVDFYSRLGIWASDHFGIAGADIASQREGKHFMDPMLYLRLRDVERAEILDAPATLTSYPWGYTQDADFHGVRLQVTVVFAERDVVALKARVTNLLTTPRTLQWVASGAPKETGQPGDRADYEDGTLWIRQMSHPASSNRLRDEPDFSIVTAIHPSFSPGELKPVDHGAYDLTSEPFTLAAQQAAFTTALVAVASIEGSAADAAKNLALTRLKTAEEIPIAAILARAERRWIDRFRTLPAEGVETEYQPLLQRCLMILEGKNTIAPQPDAAYGRLMGPHLGTFPSRPGYEAFWIWDSAFQARGFAEWNVELAKENILLVLHNQNPDGGLRMVHPDSSISSAQPPLLAWASLRIYEKEQAVNPRAARAFLKTVYPKLVRWHKWWDRTRDPNGDGLYSWPDNLASGRDDAPDWDTADGKAGYQNDFGSTRNAAVDLNSYLLKDLQTLAKLAQALGRSRDAGRWQDQANSLGQRIVDHLYDPQRNLFFSADDHTGQLRRILTPASFLPLWAGVPLPDEAARRMIEETLLNPRDFFGNIPFPSVAYSDPHYDASGARGYWRGPTWMNLSYFMLEVLSRYGYETQAETARRRLLTLAMAHGIQENYDSQSGHPGAHNNPNFGWSAAMLVPLARRSYKDEKAMPSEPAPATPAPVALWLDHENVEIFGRSIQLGVRVVNRGNAAVTGHMEVTTPWGWRSVWEKLPEIHLAPGDTGAMTVSLRLFPRFRRQRGPYTVRVSLVSPSGEKLSDSEFVVRPAEVPGEWDGPSLDAMPLAELKTLLVSLPPFKVQLENQNQWGGHGLEGMLAVRDTWRGTKAMTQHIANGDFIRHVAFHLPDGHPVRRTLIRILESPVSAQDKDREARRYMEFLRQHLYDREHPDVSPFRPQGHTLGLLALAIGSLTALAAGRPELALAFTFPIAMALFMPPASLPVIGIVHNSIYLAGGGVNTVMKQQIDGLIAKGFRVQVFVRDPDEYQSENPQVEVIRLNGGRPLIDEMRERLISADIFLIHNMLSTDIDTHMRDTLRQLIAEWKQVKRFIAWTHDIFNISHLPARGFLEDVQYVAISDPRRDRIADYLGISGDAIKVIPNSWHIRGYLGLSAEVNWLWHHYHLYSADYVAFYPVRLASNKHVQRAIDIVGAMNRLGKKTYLLLPGPHDQWEEDNYKTYKAQAAGLNIADKILFLADIRSNEGRPLILSDKMMSDIYQLCSVVLATSVDEGFGQFGPEAGFRGVPVAALPIPAIEYALQGTSYFRIRDENPSAVARHLIPYLEERVNVKRGVFQRFNFDLNFSKYWRPLFGLPAEEEPYRIGSQTSLHYHDLPRIEDQFMMAFHNGLNSFEIYFEEGFVPHQIKPELRAWFKSQAAEKDVQLLVRAPLVDPTRADGLQLLWDALGFAKDTGASILIIEMGPVDLRHASEGLARIIENARQHGIRVAFQNGRTTTAEDVNALVHLFVHAYPGWVGASVTLGPAQQVQGAVEFLRRLQAPLFNVQLSDSNSAGAKHLRFGAGSVPVDEVVDELVRRWYRGPMNFAYFFGNIARDRYELEEKFLSRIPGLRRQPRLSQIAWIALIASLGAAASLVSARDLPAHASSHRLLESA
jgi:glycogen debranching enzyme